MWREVCRVMIAEWLRVRKSRAMAAGLVTYLAVVAMFYLTYHLLVRRSFTGIPTGFYLSGSVLSAAVTSLEFAMTLIVAFSVAREFSAGTIQQVWVRPLSRMSWLSGKLLTSVVVLKVWWVLTLLFVLVVAGVQLGFSDLMEKEYLIHSAGSLWWALLLTVALTTLALAAEIGIVAVCALIIGNPGGTIAVAVIARFILQLASNWDLLRPLILPTYVTAPLGQFIAMSKGLPLPESWGHLTRTCLIGSLVWILAGWLWASWIVKRREVLN
ncbi:MAG: ABC transporter permease [candidate division Zixibacteria bacterium]|nr:ABC transporter permease [candidate division Zixibacteria bacterium]